MIALIMLVNFVYAVLICLSSFGGPEHSNTEQENELLTLLKHGEHRSDRHKEESAVSSRLFDAFSLINSVWSVVFYLSESCCEQLLYLIDNCLVIHISCNPTCFLQDAL